MVRCKNLKEVGQADFIIPVNGVGYYKRLYEHEAAHTYSVEEINDLLGTELWYYVMTPWNEFLFFCTVNSGQERNVVAEAYAATFYSLGKYTSYNIGKVEYYGRVLVAHMNHVDFEQLLKCKLNLRWRVRVLLRNHDVFYPVASNRKKREMHPAKGMFYGLEELQKLVGGYIELVNVDDYHYIVCHEEELVRRNPRKEIIFNVSASILAQKIIWGPALLIKKTRLEV